MGRHTNCTADSHDWGLGPGVEVKIKRGQKVVCVSCGLEKGILDNGKLVMKDPKVKRFTPYSGMVRGMAKHRAPEPATD